MESKYVITQSNAGPLHCHVLRVGWSHTLLSTLQIQRQRHVRPITEKLESVASHAVALTTLIAALLSLKAVNALLIHQKLRMALSPVLNECISWSKNPDINVVWGLGLNSPDRHVRYII